MLCQKRLAFLTWMLPRVVAGILLLLFSSPAVAQDTDTLAPQLRDFTFSPTSIDTSAAPQAVTVTFSVTDNLSGAFSPGVSFISPSGSQSQFAFGNLTTGTNRDGIFVGSVSFPQFSENGTWTVSSVFVQDAAGNFTSLGTAALQARGFPVELTVFSNPADVSPPVITAIDLSPATVDVSGGPQTIVVTLDVTDDLSGAIFTPLSSGSFFGFFPVQFSSPSGKQTRFTASQEFALVSGTPLSGRWQATLEMPRFSEPGRWRVEFLQLRDVASNQLFLSSSGLASLGIDAALTVSSNPADVTAPQLTALSYSPTVINTSRAGQSVSVTLNITDDLAGAAFTPTTEFLSFFEAGIQFRSPSGQQFNAAGFFNGFHLISGTPLNGAWQGTVFFPRFSEDGTWRVLLVQLKDATRNAVEFDTAALEARGFPTTLVVLRPSLIGDGTIADPAAGGSIVDDTFGNRARVIVPPGVLDQPTAVAIDVFQDPLDVATPSGFEAPGTHFVNIDLTPEPQFPLRAPGLTIVLPLPNALPAGTLLPLFRIDPATGNLVPAIGVSGAAVIGIVDAAGVSATFTGIARLSTVVGLIPSVIPVSIDVKPGEAPNTINCTADGNITVAVLSRLDFSAASIDANTVRFGKTGSEAAERHTDRLGKSKRHLDEDANGDGLMDMVFHFNLPDTGFSCADLQGEMSSQRAANLTGKTITGRAFAGTDMILLRKK